MIGEWNETDPTFMPPLTPEGQEALAGIPGGKAFHLAVAANVCNGLHGSGSHATDCRVCPYRLDCGQEIEAALLFAGKMVRKPANIR